MRAFDFASEILDCACMALGDRCPGRACVVPGSEVSIENCCAGNTGGQLTVNLVRMYPSADFPAPLIAPYNCNAPYMVADYNLQIARCVPVGNASRPPTCAALEATALEVFNDMENIYNALLCCLKSSETMKAIAGPRFPFIFGEVTSIGPEGGCVGALVPIFVAMASCPGC